MPNNSCMQGKQPFAAVQQLLTHHTAGTSPPPDLPKTLYQQPQYDFRGREGEEEFVRANRPPLPSMILSNVRSLQKKMDGLRINARVCHEYLESSMLVVTETWLQQNIPDSPCELESFSLIRLDRSENKYGGLLCFY